LGLGIGGRVDARQGLKSESCREYPGYSRHQRRRSLRRRPVRRSSPRFSTRLPCVCYDPATARKSVWQFLRTADPRIGMRRFADAAGIPLEELVAAAKRGKK
jgi:hypothetical protein